VPILQNLLREAWSARLHFEMRGALGVLLVVIFCCLDTGNKLPWEFACRRPTDQVM
jgi:hypothetical protein